MSVKSNVLTFLSGLLLLSCGVRAPQMSNSDEVLPPVSSSNILLPLWCDPADLLASMENKIPKVLAKGEKKTIVWGYEAEYTRNKFKLLPNSTSGLVITFNIIEKKRKRITIISWPETDKYAIKVKIDFQFNKNWKLEKVVTAETRSKEMRKHLNRIENEIEDALKKDSVLVKVQNSIDSLWAIVSTPKILNETPRLVLNLNPSKIYWSKFLSIQGKMKGGLVVVVKPEITDKPEAVKNVRVLPQAEFIEKPENEFRIRFPVKYTYAEANKVLEVMKGYEFEKVPGTVVSVKDIKVYGKGNCAVLRVRTSGIAYGKLYLTGRPVIDSLSYVLQLEKKKDPCDKKVEPCDCGFDYSLETTQVALKGVDFAAHEKFRKKLFKAAFFPLASDVNEGERIIKEKISKSFRGKITLEKVELEPKVINCTKNEFLVILEFNGRISGPGFEFDLSDN